jgi:Zeta toxin
MAAVDTARENATLREEFLRRGLATERELDRLGWVSHQDLDLWEQAGALELGVKGLEEAWGLGLLHGEVFNRRVIRGRGGRFGAGVGPHVVPGQSLKRIERNVGPRIKRTTPVNAGLGGPVAELKGKRGAVKGKEFTVHPTPGKRRGIEHVMGDQVHGIPERMSTQQFHAEATSSKKIHKAGRASLQRKAIKAHQAGTAAARAGDHEAAAQHHERARSFENAMTDRAQTFQHGQQALFKSRSKKLEKRIKRSVASAGEQVTPAAGGTRSEHDLSAAEVHFNDAGRVSQKTLLAYAEEAATKPTTAEMYRSADGSYHPSRAQLHADILDKLLRQHAQDEEGHDLGLSGTGDYLKAPDGSPTVIFTGGGYASGKGGVVKRLQQDGQWPQDAMLIDPDLIKAELPEFQLAAMDDPEANLRVYAEAWDIAQQAVAQAQKRGLNVVVDGITDTNADEVAKRVKSFTDAGYENPQIHYVSVPTDVAIARAIKRAKKGKTAADRRMIPEVIMRSVHRDVSATIPGVLAKAKEMGANVSVYDTNQGVDEATGEKNQPKLVAHADGASGQIHLPDANGYQQIVNKASEQIEGVPDVQTGAKGVWKTGGQDVSIDPEVENTLGRQLVNNLPETNNSVKLPQPTGDAKDPGALMRLGETKGLPAFQKLLDLGRGIITSLGGQTQDISEGKDFKQVGQDIQDNMDKPHVIIAPVKSMRRALEKAAADNTPNDLSQTHDVVRGTITVPTAQDLPDAIDKIVKQAEAQGWTVERTKARQLNENGGNRSTGNGYGDTSLILRAGKEGGEMTAELQVNTNPMWWTKEVGPGHAYYELERQILGRAQAEGRKPSKEEEALVADIQKAAKPLYDRAWGASLHGGGTSNIENVVLGNAEERAHAAQALQDLREETQALMGEAPTATSQRGRRPRAT